MSEMSQGALPPALKGLPRSIYGKSEDLWP
ncbi:hypothetical protein SAMN05444339_101762 [Loktanella atrilutea]|uniref:Uncharacterized protein n=1 Tax=Loktanella atrilutea TaxID=366533 RepID=A0A1M4UK12_LOKAT|nr:hypothetical protein SAMN05444339_101762 [Loktanella atrilutea]